MLNPSRYLDQKVTVTGQFGGRNLLGDLPDAPGKSRYDFVLRSADAAIWVINMRPKIKDANGKDFELGLDARIDTGRWLSVRGTLQQGRGLLWIDAEAGQPGDRQAADRDRHRGRADPRAGRAAAGGRLQRADPGRNRRVDGDDGPDPVLARHRSVDAEGSHQGVSYLESQSVERGEPDDADRGVHDAVSPPNRVLELKFTKPLERFRTLKVDLLDGILGTDGQPLKPWTLTFASADRETGQTLHRVLRLPHPPLAQRHSCRLRAAAT